MPASRSYDRAPADIRPVSIDPGFVETADDSGIGAVALGGRPGIHSARYGGEGASDEENLEKLLREVAAAGDERGAYYTCALALVEADGTAHVFEDRCHGHLIERPRGEGGFGYDPAVVPGATGPGDQRTYSELSQEEKNAISHRGGVSIASNSFLIALKLAAGIVAFDSITALRRSSVEVHGGDLVGVDVASTVSADSRPTPGCPASPAVR